MKLTAGKILAPGVVSHCVSLVEHPELVAQRIVRYARIVGRENVVACTDCGFGTSAIGDQLHPDVSWAKLRALVDGAPDRDQDAIVALKEMPGMVACLSPKWSDPSIARRRRRCGFMSAAQGRCERARAEERRHRLGLSRVARSRAGISAR